MSWQEYLPENFKETYDYSAKIWRSGLASFPPLIVTCAITGGNQGKEANPNLPETVEEQVESAYEAYKAGAAMVHIHARREDGMPVGDFETFRKILSAIKKEADVVIGAPIDLSDIGKRGKRRNPSPRFAPLRENIFVVFIVQIHFGSHYNISILGGGVYKNFIAFRVGGIFSRENYI